MPMMAYGGLKRDYPSHYLALSQLRDLLRGEAEFGEHLLGLLANLRCPNRRPVASMSHLWTP
jgi:hypothetical protein